MRQVDEFVCWYLRESAGLSDADFEAGTNVLLEAAIGARRSQQSEAHAKLDAASEAAQALGELLEESTLQKSVIEAAANQQRATMQQLRDRLQLDNDSLQKPCECVELRSKLHSAEGIYAAKEAALRSVHQQNMNAIERQRDGFELILFELQGIEQHRDGFEHSLVNHTMQQQEAVSQAKEQEKDLREQLAKQAAQHQAAAQEHQMTRDLLREATESMQSGAKHTELQQLQQERNELQQQLKELKGVTAQLTKQIAADAVMHDQLVTSQQAETNTTTALKSLLSECSELDAQLQIVTAARLAAELGLAAAKEDTDTLHHKLQTAEKQAEKAMSNHLAQLESLQQQKQQADATVAELRKAVDGAFEQSQKAELVATRLQIVESSCEALVAQLEAAHESSEASQQQLQQQLDDSMLELRQL